MLWSLAKAFLFFLLLAAITWGATLLSATDGGMRIAMLGKEFTLGPLQAVIASLISFVALWILMRLAGFLIAVLRFFTGDETALSRYFDRNRERRGYNALSEAMLALSSGEHRVALSRAAKAERLLAKPELTNLITAQAALALGDTGRAETAYKALLSDDRARFAGVQGLMKMKLAEGDPQTALKLAQEAAKLKPRNAELQTQLLQLQTAEQDWEGARATLEAQRKAGTLPREVWKRRDALLALQEAKELLSDSASIEAQEAAIAANKASPDLIPAATLAARSYTAKGNEKLARRVLRKAWEAQPHPDLAAAYAEIAPNETAAARLERFRELLDANPTHAESRLLLAELKVAAGDFVGAQAALGTLAQDKPTARVMTIMAAIERGTGADDAVVRGWMARALTAPRGPQWVCDSCKAIHAHWGPVCSNCHGFDTLAWRDAGDTEGPSATQTEMLPLIVGRPHEAEAPQPPPPATVVPEDEIPEAEIADPIAEPAKEAPSSAASAPADDIAVQGTKDTRLEAGPHPVNLVTPEELARKGAF